MQASRLPSDDVAMRPWMCRDGGMPPLLCGTAGGTPSAAGGTQPPHPTVYTKAIRIEGIRKGQKKRNRNGSSELEEVSNSTCLEIPASSVYPHACTGEKIQSPIFYMKRIAHWHSFSSTMKQLMRKTHGCFMSREKQQTRMGLVCDVGVVFKRFFWIGAWQVKQVEVRDAGVWRRSDVVTVVATENTLQSVEKMLIHDEEALDHCFQHEDLFQADEDSFTMTQWIEGVAELAAKIEEQVVTPVFEQADVMLVAIDCDTIATVAELRIMQNLHPFRIIGFHIEIHFVFYFLAMENRIFVRNPGVVVPRHIEFEAPALPFEEG